MILGTKHEELFFVLVPICTETTEHRCSIIHRVSEHTELHVRIRNDAAVKEHEVWQRHGFTSFSAAPMATREEILVQSTTRTGSAAGRASIRKARRLTKPTNVAAK